MKKFKFRAIKSSGEIYKGIKESNDKFSLYYEMKVDGDTLISADEVTEKRNYFEYINSLFNRAPEHQKIIFVKNLGSMIEAGLPIVKSLSVLEKQIGNKYLKSVIRSLGADIRKGNTLSEASKMYPDVFPNLFVFMVKAGEESGTLSESLKIIGNQMDSIYKLKKKIKGAMIYPGIILSLMVLIGVLMLIYVVPSITATFKDLNVELPFLTRVLIYTSDFLKDNIFSSIVYLFLVYIGFYLFSKSISGKKAIDFIVLKIPVISGLVKETNMVRIARTMSSLLTSGVSFSESILITSEVVQNFYFKEILIDARARIEKGETLSSIFLKQTKLCPIFVGEMMAVGEETGRLPSMLMEVAVFYEEAVDQKTKDMSTIIEPFLMIIIGVGVGFFALAMIKPIYSVMDTI